MAHETEEARRVPAALTARAKQKGRRNDKKRRLTFRESDYRPPPAKLPSAVQESWYSEIIRQAETPRGLEQAGYQLVNLSPFELAQQTRFYRRDLGCPSSLGNLLLNQSAFDVFAGYLKRQRLDPCLAVFSNLVTLASQRAPQPRLVYAQVMLPHFSYRFDRNGHKWPAWRKSETKKSDYLEQLLFVNQLATNAISAMLAGTSRPSVIIVQGDHGSRLFKKETSPIESTTILNAYYLPSGGANWVYPGITAVNSFRMLLNHYLGAHYEHLPDLQPGIIRNGSAALVRGHDR